MPAMPWPMTAIFMGAGPDDDVTDDFPQGCAARWSGGASLPKVYGGRGTADHRALIMAAADPSGRRHRRGGMNAIALDPGRYRQAGRRTPRPEVRAVSAVAPTGKAFAEMIAAIAARADRGAFAALFVHFAPRVKSYMLRLGAEPLLA